MQNNGCSVIQESVAPVAPEFGAWPVDKNNFEKVSMIRKGFDDLLTQIITQTPPGNERYIALVKTKLEEACFFAVKGVAKPTTVRA